MTLESERAVRATLAVSLDFRSARHGIVVARLAELSSSTTAVEEGDRATEVALPVTVLVAMLLAHLLTIAKLFIRARLAHELFFLHLALSLHRLAAVLHAAEVGLRALEALVKCAVMHRETSDIIEIDVSLGDYSSISVISLLDGLLGR